MSSKGIKGLALPLILLALLLSGCGPKSSGTIVEDKVNVVTTFYPIYEFAQEIGGEDVNAINLLPVGVEPHDWTPRSQDIVNTSKAQLFLYNGAGLEGWVPNFLKGLDSSSKVQAVEVSKGIDYIMTDDEEDHDHGGENGEEASGDSLHTDPHTWVSPKSALLMAQNIKNSLVQVDPAHKDGYEERYGKVAERLKALDAKFETELAKVPNKEIVVSHQAFAYLCRDYGLTQHAIMGLSPDAEPRGQDLVKLAELVKKERIRYIFFEELVSDKLAKTLAAEAGVSTMVLNPVEGLTEQEQQNNDNYFTLMEKNLQNLILALK
ncbi:zinc transport system substrate-binding protein [Paenibacillus sophorae]|uniref:Zinc ABC transporter substrate-binding protein n=1 Tax=Paenibacillus sophorae TaxID=1333845 RepID=A0A1H8N405_9BACL|nr:zinc ABC transporter substrate-binding protein [Paenibacillus sophorae]QWU14797.1 zinc ABC transporter substrate-binding protein [Paenibacillus sophorae]SEO24246.1 zinc transport system substrate-binding protein [Paenibacillus sophorae]